MATPVSTVLEQVRRHINGNRRMELNWLNGAVTTTSQTTLTLLDPLGGITPRSYIGLGDELLYVRSVSGQVATVRRGMLGTTAATHLTDAEVEVNPRFARGVILDHMKDEIDSWGPDLFPAPLTASVSVSSPIVRGYNLSLGTYHNVLEVRRAPLDSTSTTWPELRQWEIDRAPDSTTFPGGTALYVKERLPDAVALKVIYTKPFTTSTFTESTDLIATVGLDVAFLDILRYGALWRLMSGTEIIRSDSAAQGEARAAEEVPPGHRINTSSGLKKLRDERIAEEKKRLVRRWGMAAA